MPCPRCQHENRPQAKFCEECASPLNVASPTARSDADPTSEVESLRHALTEAVDQQKATAELLQTRDRELADAQEQQTATSEILRVISSSPTDVQPVFAAVLRSAARLCDAFDATIFQVDGDGLRIVAHEGPIPTTPVGAIHTDTGNGRGTCGARPALIVTFFTAGPGATTLPLKVYSMIKSGMSPEINALSALFVILSMSLIGLSLLFQRR